MKRFIFALAIFFSITTGQALNVQWTNLLGGDWATGKNWSPNVPPTGGDVAYITNAGTYTVTVTNPATFAILSNFTLGGPSGLQTLLIGNNAGPAINVTNRATVNSHGLIVMTNGGFRGNLTLLAGAELQLTGAAIKFIYGLNLINQGTVTWSGGLLETGGTTVSNGGLWQVDGDNSLAYGGNGIMFFTNYGTFRKASGSGTSDLGPFNLINQPGGLVEAQTGTMKLYGDVGGSIGGTFNAVGSAKINIVNGIWTDAGGTATGTNLFTGGTLNLRTNTLVGFHVTGGDIYVTGTNTFQQAGAITNMVLEGANLCGTNKLAGSFTLLSGNLKDLLTVQSTGQLMLCGNAQFYGFKLFNQGTVTWTNGGISVGATVISNGGLWQASGDNTLAYGGVGTPTWANYGTFRKTGGSGVSSLDQFYFTNLPSGLVQVDSGIIELPPNTTNNAGTWRLNGGTLRPKNNALVLNGGTLDGFGSMGNLLVTGGIVTPGAGAAGRIGFMTGLNFAPGATLSLDGTGLTPGTLYDQLSVTGAVALSNCTLQITSLPAVAVGTTFVIITNDAADAVSGTFNGLPENALLFASGQPFRIHYTGGNGNDVTLVRDSGVSGVGPQLLTGSGSYSNGFFRLSGTGGVSTVFTIQATTNYLQWTNLGTATSDVSGHFSFTDSNAFRFHYRFYRTTN